MVDNRISELFEEYDLKEEKYIEIKNNLPKEYGEITKESILKINALKTFVFMSVFKWINIFVIIASIFYLPYKYGDVHGVAFITTIVLVMNLWRVTTSIHEWLHSLVLRKKCIKYEIKVYKESKSGATIIREWGILNKFEALLVVVLPAIFLGVIPTLIGLIFIKYYVSTIFLALGLLQLLGSRQDICIGLILFKQVRNKDKVVIGPTDILGLYWIIDRG